MSELPPEGYPEGSRRVWGLTNTQLKLLGSRSFSISFRYLGSF